jgi:hypothetical protein
MEISFDDLTSVEIFSVQKEFFDLKPGTVFSSAYDEVLYLRITLTYPSAAVRTKRPRNQTSQVSGKVAFLTSRRSWAVCKIAGVERFY